MRILLLILLICVAGALYKAGKLPYFPNNTPEDQPPVAASVPVEATPSPTPQVAQTPPPTHSVEQATAQAVQLYPALAQKDSNFNKAFVLLYTQSKEKNPQLIATSDWPIRLANQVAASLGVAPQPLPTATPAAATPLAAMPKPTPWQPMSTRMDQPKHKK